MFETRKKEHEAKLHLTDLGKGKLNIQRLGCQEKIVVLLGISLNVRKK